MGALHIEGVGPIQIDDELLDHIFTVVTSKLRRREPVLLSWTDDADQEQRMFLSEKALIRAEFDSPNRSPRDRAWLERLMVAASSNAGLSVSAAIHDRDRTRIPTEPAAGNSPPDRSEAASG
ncbi:hypothetical protein [Agromyces sp. NPDC057865]|uniref:DUF7882 family protein n=1 Tax=Agromyces sp. NPDC057865 TaxID=3346267 RepID=UPI00366F5361